MQVLGIGQQPLPGFRDGRLHRVEGTPVTGQHGKLQHLMQGLLQRVGAGLHAVVRCRPGPQLPDRHAVGGQCAGFVNAQHGGGAQQFDRRNTSGQYVFARQPPGAQAHEEREHNRQFLGKDRHRQRQARQQAMEPVVKSEPVGKGEGARHCQADDGNALDDAAGLALDRGAFVAQACERLADSAQGAALAGGQHAAACRALRHKCSGKHLRGVVGIWRGAGVARHGPRLLEHGSGLTSQHGLIDREIR